MKKEGWVAELHNWLCPGQVDFTGSLGLISFFFCSTLILSVVLPGQLRITEALLGGSQSQNCICVILR